MDVWDLFAKFEGYSLEHGQLAGTWPCTDRISSYADINFRDGMYQAKVNSRWSARLAGMSSRNFVSHLWSSPCLLLTTCSGTITGNPKATMEYINYHWGIILNMHIQLVGWAHKKFACSSSLGKLLLVLVICTGNPWVFFPIPVPVPLPISAGMGLLVPCVYLNMYLWQVTCRFTATKYEIYIVLLY